MKISIHYDGHPELSDSKQVISEMVPAGNTAFGWRSKRAVDHQELVGKTIRAVELSGGDLLLEIE